MGNATFTWSSKKQSIVSLSTYEVEYITATSCVYHAIWLRKLLKDLQKEYKEATRIFIDNKSSIPQQKNLVHHEHSKHIDTRFHFIKEHVKEGDVELINVRTIKQITKDKNILLFTEEA
jgi:hypothetical protein